MYRSRQSLTLFGDEVAHRAFGRYSSKRAGTFPSSRCGCEPLGDEAVEWARPIERHKPRHRFAVVGDSDFVTVTHDFEVPAEVIAKFLNSSFHQPIMALLQSEISPF